MSWSLPGTQSDIAEAVGWKLQKVKEYSRLQKVEQNAWALIVETVTHSTSKVECSTFNEYILRPILKLTPGQQLGEGGKFPGVVAEKTVWGTTFFTQPFHYFKVARCRNMPR